MFKVNAYNLKRKEQNLIFLQIVFIAAILLANLFLPPERSSTLNYVFIAVWAYLLFWHMKLKKMAYAEELRQFRISIKKGEKREYPRFPVDKSDKVRAFFSVIKYLWLFELKKKRFAKIIDISEGGLLINTDTEGLVEGEKAAGIKIEIPDAGNITTDGLIVRVMGDKCAIRFIDIRKSAKGVILQFASDKMPVEPPKKRLK